MTPAVAAAASAWLIAAGYYLYQYALRSAPGVMMPELASGFGVSAAAIASMVGLFYWGYAPFSLVAGAAIDRLGPRAVVPAGAAAVGVGALLFASGNVQAASVGRFLQGAGGAFAFVGAVYLATLRLPASRAATLIGATQMMGMAGGSAGQFAVGPMLQAGVRWNAFWLWMGVAGFAMSGALVWLLPGSPVRRRGAWLPRAGRAMRVVFRNPQSLLCGAIAGLLFIPTTIFDMVWGVRYLQDARGLDYVPAVLRSATVPLGWIIGCPLMGWLSDRIGRRKPVLIGGAAMLLACVGWALYGQPGVFPPYVVGVVTGIASGAAMLPYTVIKEANPPDVSGTATGVVNFLNMGVTALLGPVFAWLMTARAAGAASALDGYQAAFTPLLYGIALAMILTLLLEETGPRARQRSSLAKAS